MITLTARARRALGVRATAYVEEHGFRARYSRYALVPDSHAARGVWRTITRVYGGAATIDRGETAYWTVDARDLAEGQAVRT